MNTTNNFLAIMLCVMAMLMPKLAWADGNFDVATLSNLTFHQSGCLKSFDVEVKAKQGGYATAYAKIAVHTGTPTSSWDRPIGDGNSWPATIDDGGMVAISSSEFEWTDQAQHNLTVSVADGVISNTVNREFSIYLWSRIPGRGVYADYCFSQKLVVENGTIKLSKDEPSLPSQEYQENGIHYLLDPNKETAEVLKPVKGSTYEGDIVIPETVTKDGIVYNVTRIGDNAFMSCSGLTSVSIPNSVTTIGEAAFGYCYGLTSVVIPNSVITIGRSAFSSCPLTSLELGNSVTTIDKSAFMGCSDLTSLIIPNSVTTIGESAFFNCYALKSLELGNSVTTIGEDAFFQCENLTSLVIPNSVTTIGEDAFFSCSSLTSLVLGNSVTTIGDKAFYGARHATSLVIPNSVTTIGSRAFMEWYALESLELGNSLVTIGATAFFQCEKLTSLVIPNSVTTIEETAFFACSGLTSLELGNSVTTIGRSAFYGCTGLTSLIIPNSVTNIGESAFSACSGLTSLELGNSVTTIESQAFSGCEGLTSIDIPNTVTTIGSEAFSNCSGLESITLGNSLTAIAWRTFAGCWSLKSIEIPNSVTLIDEYAFRGCTGLKSATIGNSVTTIKQNAFYQCSGMSSVTLGSSVSSIEKYCFSDCTNLKHFYCFSDVVPTTGDYVFRNVDVANVELYVLSTLRDEYSEADPWKNFNLKSAYKITTSCDEELGSCIGGDKTYLEGETATIIAIPIGAVSFLGWEDGSMENPRSFKVESTTPLSYTALLRKGGFVVNVSTNDSELGTATAENVVYLEATPTTAGEFKQWSDGNKDNPRKIALETLTEDKEITAVFEVGTMSLMDGESYTSTTPYTYKKLNYARGYNNNVWSAWFVPFAVNATTLKDNGFDAAYIEGMHRYDRDDDGVIDVTVMEVVKIKNGRLRAGTPYLVKAGETYAYPLSLTNVTVESANDIHNIETATATADYNFSGTYTGVTAEEVQAADNYYSMNAQGELVHRNGKILPLRWFMELIDKGGMYDAEPGSSPASVIYVKVIGEEDTETGLRTIYPESEQKVEKFDGMFDLSGRRLSAPQRGINIINGKKTLIK